MVLRIHNQYSEKVWVAIMYPDAYCGAHEGQPWEKAGWLKVFAGDTVVALGGDVSPKWMYYVHAEADNGTEWGNDVPSRCPNARFEMCADNNEDPEMPWRRFAGVHSSGSNLTVHLRPS